MRSIVIAVWLLIGVTAYGEEIKFKKFTSLKDALAQSKKENKPVFVDTWASWCGWCTFMDENIFSDDEVAEYFNANFIALKLDADGNNADDFMMEYGISGLPALLILDEKGEVLSRSDGAITETIEFIEFGELAYYKLYPETSPWYKNEKEFNAGNRDYLFLYEYAFSLLETDVSYEKLSEINALYWENTPSKSLIDTTNFLMFYIFVDDLMNPLMDTFIKEQPEIISIVGEGVYYQKALDVIQSNIDTAVLNVDKKQYRQTLSFTKDIFEKQELIDYDELVATINDIWEGN